MIFTILLFIAMRMTCVMIILFCLLMRIVVMVWYNAVKYCPCIGEYEYINDK